MKTGCTKPSQHNPWNWSRFVALWLAFVVLSTYTPFLVLARPSADPCESSQQPCGSCGPDSCELPTQLSNTCNYEGDSCAKRCEQRGPEQQGPEQQGPQQQCPNDEPCCPNGCQHCPLPCCGGMPLVHDLDRIIVYLTEAVSLLPYPDKIPPPIEPSGIFHPPRI